MRILKEIVFHAIEIVRGILSIIDGIVTILTLGFYYPSLTIRFIIAKYQWEWYTNLLEELEKKGYSN